MNNIYRYTVMNNINDNIFINIIYYNIIYVSLFYFSKIIHYQNMLPQVKIGITIAIVVIVLIVVGLIVAVLATPKIYKDQYTKHADEIKKIVGEKGLTVYESVAYPWNWGG